MKTQIIREPQRLAFLDFLRFIAAFAVLIQHTLEHEYASFREFCTNYFQFGIFGVTLFFLTSGFIIPISLEKYGSLKSFWIGRIFRLYPLYLTTIIITLFLFFFRVVDGQMPTMIGFVANLFMVAKFTGQPLIQGLYWTLNLEMVFYLLTSVLFVVGWLDRSTILAIFALIMAFVIGVIGTQVLHLFESGWGICFQLATMFVGTLYYRFMTGVLRKGTLISIIILSMLVMLSITFFNLFGKDKPEELGVRSFVPATAAFFFAYLVFSVGFFLRNLSIPKPFLFLGMISYSIYLVQATVLALVLPVIENQLVASTIAICLTLVASCVTYYFVEKPFIVFGKKMSKNLNERSRTTSIPISEPRALGQ